MRLRCALTILTACILSSGVVKAETVSSEATPGSDALQAQGILVAAETETKSETETKTDPAPSGDVQERGIMRSPVPRVMPGTVKPPTTNFQCGWNPRTLKSECTCRGTTDCNNMFISGFCGGGESCDNGTDTCRCDLKM